MYSHEKCNNFKWNVHISMSNLQKKIQPLTENDIVVSDN